MARLSVNQVFHPHMNIGFSHHGNSPAMDVLSIPYGWHVKFTYQLLTCWCILHQSVRWWKNNLWSGKNVELHKFIVCSFAQSAFQINLIPASVLVLEKKSLNNLHRGWTTREVLLWKSKQRKVPEAVQRKHFWSKHFLVLFICVSILFLQHKVLLFH